MCIIDCLSTIVFILPLHLDYTKVIILILWWRNFQLEYWRTFQLVSTIRKKLYINFFGIIYIFTLITSEESRTASLMSASRNSVMSIIFCFLSVNSTS